MQGSVIEEPLMHFLSECDSPLPLRASVAYHRARFDQAPKRGAATLHALISSAVQGGDAEESPAGSPVIENPTRSVVGLRFMRGVLVCAGRPDTDDHRCDAEGMVINEWESPGFPPAARGYKCASI